MMEQAVTDYVGATILALTPHFTPVASWADPGMPAAAIVLDGYRRQITWTPDSGWRYTRLYSGTAAQRGPAYYLDAGPVPAPQVLVERLRRWQAGGESWSLTQPSYPPGGVLEALRAAVPDPSAQRSCPDCGQWTAVDPADRDVCCETCGTRLLDAQATTRTETPMPDPMTPEDEQRIRELLDMHPALLQPEAIELRRHLLDARDDVTAARAEVERLRAELAEADHVATVTGEKLTAVRGQRARAETERDEARAEAEQWRATFGETALRDGLARMARVEAERDRIRLAWDSARVGMEKLREALVAADKLAAGLRAELAEEKRDFDRLSKLYVSACQGASERAELRAERDRLGEQVQRVREKHSPIAAHVGDPDDDDNLVTACGECEVPYPCPTIRALDGTGDGS